MKQSARRGSRSAAPQLAHTRAKSVPGGARLFHRMYTRLGCQGRPPHFTVEFFPYANLVNTVRLREDSAHVRVSDVLLGAPLEVMEAAAAVLLGRLYRRHAPRELIDLYRKFSTARGTHRKVLAIRSRRGTRVQSGPKGAAHNLAPMFSRLNNDYFNGRLHRPRLGWSKRHWRAQLGCFDPGLDQIVINTRLDGAGVPKYVVEYVLYHEMLHVRHPIRVAACGLQAHSADFRRAERRFKHYERARKFLEHL
ncbi:MAG TPA: hypothetical protein VLV89_03720 [Candidatus Acidoferrum sp.]|nr:hypothetical protein [Candidatus Acidoferrum sp.]